MTLEQEHAELGALLARCCVVMMYKKDDGIWRCVIGLSLDGVAFRGEGPTQLAAIKSAVESAEKGVRE